MSKGGVGARDRPRPAFTGREGLKCRICGVSERRRHTRLPVTGQGRAGRRARRFARRPAPMNGGGPTMARVWRSSRSVRSTTTRTSPTKVFPGTRPGPTGPGHHSACGARPESACLLQFVTSATPGQCSPRWPGFVAMVWTSSRTSPGRTPLSVLHPSATHAGRLFDLGSVGSSAHHQRHERPFELTLIGGVGAEDLGYRPRHGAHSRDRRADRGVRQVLRR